MTRAELVYALCERFSQYSPKQMEMAVREIFDLMTETLASGERIEIRGFGSFEIRRRAPRLAHNPKTGEPVEMGVRRVVHFKPGVGLRARVNIKPRKSEDSES